MSGAPALMLETGEAPGGTIAVTVSARDDTVGSVDYRVKVREPMAYEYARPDDPSALD